MRRGGDAKKKKTPREKSQKKGKTATEEEEGPNGSKEKNSFNQSTQTPSNRTNEGGYRKKEGKAKSGVCVCPMKEKK